MKKHEQLLIALRRIIRAVDIQSRKLMKVTGLTGPQLLIMKAVEELGEVTTGSIARHVNLSHATVTSILDRLVKRGFVIRTRNTSDKRIVNVNLTSEGCIALEQAPTLLQDDFAERFQQLKDWEQSLLLSSVQRLAELMDAQGIEASPLLEINPISTDRSEGNLQIPKESSDRQGY